MDKREKSNGDVSFFVMVSSGRPSRYAVEIVDRCQCGGCQDIPLEIVPKHPSGDFSRIEWRNMNDIKAVFPVNPLRVSLVVLRKAGQYISLLPQAGGKHSCSTKKCDGRSSLCG